MVSIFTIGHVSRYFCVLVFSLAGFSSLIPQLFEKGRKEKEEGNSLDFPNTNKVFEVELYQVQVKLIHES